MPIVVLTCTLLIFYHPFGNKETKKFKDFVTFCLIWSTSKVSTPTADANHGNFLTLNLTVLNNSSCFSPTSSFSPIGTGNLPIEVTYLPISLVTLLESESETKRRSNFLAHFLISLASLLNFLRSSILTASIFNFLAYSIWFKVPITTIFMFDLHGLERTVVELNLLSFSGL